MPRYQVARNRVAAAITHIESYLTILGLIEQELANPGITLGLETRTDLKDKRQSLVIGLYLKS